MGSDRLDLRVLGPLEVESPDGARPVPAGRPRALLALLALRTGKWTSEDFAVESLWHTTRPTGSTRRALAVAARRLRPVVGDALRQGPGGYRLEGGTLDAVRFEEFVEAAIVARRADRVAEADRHLAAAFALWRGDPYPELSDVAAAGPEIHRLGQLRLTAVEEANAIRLAGEVSYRFVADLERLVRKHPDREVLWRQLAVGLYRTGRRVEALRACERARKALAGLGLAVAPATVSLERALAAQDPSLDAGPAD